MHHAAVWRSRNRMYLALAVILSLNSAFDQILHCFRASGVKKKAGHF